MRQHLLSTGQILTVEDGPIIKTRNGSNFDKWTETTTLARVNKIREHYCLQPLDMHAFFGCGHACMDFIDQRAGLITRHMFQEIDSRHVSHFVLAPLGNRVRRHERHIERQKAPAYFWLGEAA